MEIKKSNFSDESSLEAQSIFRMLDALNSLRRLAGLNQLTLDSYLIAAAETHSQDMALQNRAWHFGSDGSSPLERANRLGYTGFILGEAISESYENEIETLSAWMKKPETKRVILHPKAKELGFFVFRDTKNKMWRTLIIGH